MQPYLLTNTSKGNPMIVTEQKKKCYLTDKQSRMLLLTQDAFTLKTPTLEQTTRTHLYEEDFDGRKKGLGFILNARDG